MRFVYAIKAVLLFIAEGVLTLIGAIGIVIGIVVVGLVIPCLPMVFLPDRPGGLAFGLAFAWLLLYYGSLIAGIPRLRRTSFAVKHFGEPGDDW